jgi:predicted O-methyltransferase YrrM
MTATTASAANVVQRLQKDRPSFHMGGDAHWASLPETMEAIRRSVKAGDTTLETGTGASTVIFAACGANHTAISPFPDEHERIRAYCKQIGVDDSRLTFIAGSSDDVLPSLLSRERTLDVAFIDGAHCFPFAHVDWSYITRALKLGGKLVMDDITIPAIAPVFRHMSLEDNWRVDGTLDDRAAEFTLLAEPAAGDDWLEQKLNAHYPDFGYAPLGRRLRLKATYRLRESGRTLAQRSPMLRKCYHQAQDLLGRRDAA